MRLLSCLLLAALLSLASGCATTGPSTVRVPIDRYPDAFDAARDVLRGRGFKLERVDARAGVITTRPRASAGFATPWIDDQSSITQEWDDFMNRNEREVRITFEPVDGREPSDDDPMAPLPDLVDEAEAGSGGGTGERIMRVRVVLERSYRPGSRIETSSIRRSTYTIDPALNRRGMRPIYSVPIDDDTGLAHRIAQDIGRRLSLPLEGQPEVAGGS